MTQQSKLVSNYDCILLKINLIWRSPSLSELTPMIFNMELTHLGSKPSKYTYQINFFNSVYFHKN